MVELINYYVKKTCDTKWPTPFENLLYRSTRALAHVNAGVHTDTPTDTDFRGRKVMYTCI